MWQKIALYGVLKKQSALILFVRTNQKKWQRARSFLSWQPINASLNEP